MELKIWLCKPSALHNLSYVCYRMPALRQPSKLFSSSRRQYKLVASLLLEALRGNL